MDESKKVREVSPAYGSPGGKLTYQDYCSLPSGHRHELMQIYERYGVQEYWIVDPVGKTIEVASRSGTGLATVRTWGAGCTMESPVLPGFVLDLAALFAGLESV